MKDYRRFVSIAFIALLLVVLLATAAWLLLGSKSPLVLQGEVEATEIRISGKLLGRIDSFLVDEGDRVHRGDTLVIINSPIVQAQYRKTEALHRATRLCGIPVVALGQEPSRAGCEDLRTHTRSVCR